MNWTGGGHMGFMGLWWILILVALVAVVWVAASAGRRVRGAGTLSAEQRLKERYAAGEIDRMTYERMLADLRK